MARFHLAYARNVMLIRLDHIRDSLDLCLLTTSEVWEQFRELAHEQIIPTQPDLWIDLVVSDVKFSPQSGEVAPLHSDGVLPDDFLPNPELLRKMMVEIKRWLLKELGKDYQY